MSSIVVEFEQGVDIDQKTTELKNRVDAAKPSLPADGNDPVVSKIEFSEQPVLIVSLVANIPLYAFDLLVDEVQDRIEQVDGVSGVNVSGIPEREISVIVDNRQLVEKQIDFAYVLRSLSGSDITLPAGSLTIDGIDYPLDVRAEVGDYQQLPEIPLGLQDGTSITVGDIAQVINGYRDAEVESRVGFPESGTQQAVTLSVTKKNGGNITAITQNVRNELEAMGQTTLEGIEWVVTYDAGDDINTQLSDLTGSGLQTFVLVFVVLLLAVGLRESIIAAVSIPLSFMLAFVAFLVAGNTINFISLFSLILSVGILVDTAIVVVEGINAKIREGKRRLTAAVETIQEFGLPLIAGTMTTIAVFFPLLFLSGVTGQFIAAIPYTVIFVLLASLFVSLAFVTTFCASFLKNRDAVSAQKDSIFTKAFHALEARYEGILRGLLQNGPARRFFELVIMVVFFVALALPATGLLKVEFFPSGDVQFAYIGIERDLGTPLDETSNYATLAEDILLEKPWIESFVTTVGKTSDYAQEISVGEQYANITLNIAEEYQSQGNALIEELRADFESARLFDAEVSVAEGGPPSGAPVYVELESESSESLRIAARTAEEILRDTPGVVNIQSGLAGNATGFDILVDRNAAFRYGISIQDVVTAIRGATDGVEVFSITQDGDDVPVYVRNRLDYTGDTGIVTKNIAPETLQSISLVGSAGERVLLGSVTEIVVSEADTQINHKDGQRVVTVTAEVSEDYNATEINAQFDQDLSEALANDIQYSFGGQAAEQTESFAETGIAFIVGLFLVFAILILQFGRLVQVLIVMSVVPFGVAGVLFGLFITGNALSFPAILGLIAMVGIVVNNSIILLSVFNQFKSEHPEWHGDDVVIKGSVSRFRAIILTTITTIIGVVPLLFADAIWAPIAYAIIFGLILCVFITLAMVPILYRRFQGGGLHREKSTADWWLTVALVILLPLVVAIAFASVAQLFSGAQVIGVLLGFVALVGLTFTFRKG